MVAFPAGFWALIILAAGGTASLMWCTAKNGAGFGGWLIPIVIGQSVAPLRSLAGLSSDIGYFQRISALPNGPVAVSGEAVLLLALIALQIATAIAMLRKRRSFPRLFVYQWFAQCAVFAATGVLAATILGVPIGQAFGKFESVRFAALAAISGMAALYILRSRRVRNTFTG